MAVIPEAETPTSVYAKEEEIEQFAKLAQPTIMAVGLGGAGSNIITWIKEKGIVGAKLMAVNTDANHLGITKADRRILIGANLTKGLGCGGYPDLGAKALLKVQTKSSKKSLKLT
jgi:cell division protein FtsZ